MKVRRTGLLTSASLFFLPALASAQSVGSSSAGNGGQAPPVIPNAPADTPRQSTVVAADRDASPATDAEPGKAGGVQDIIVTATRRSANLQTVPIAVTALQSNELAAAGVRSAVDVPRLVTGLAVSRNGAGTNLYLRGVGTNSSGFNTESPIASYIDGFYLPNPGSTLFSFNNIERIEVLKGPQGTLYGRNATGGLVNVITRDPSRDMKIDGSFGYANYNTLSLNLYASEPLSDTVSAAISFTHTKQSDGWGRDILTGSANQRFRDTGLQGKLRWEPGSRTKVTLEGLYSSVHSDQGVVVTIYPGSVGTDGTPYLGRYVSADRRDPDLSSELYLIGLKVEQDLGFANLTSLTGYIHSKADFTPNQSGEPGQPVAGRSATNSNLFGRSRTFSQEFQLSSKAASGSPFSWIAGLYYFNDNTEVGNGTFGTCVGTVCAPTPVPTLVVGVPKTRSYAGYAEGTYTLAGHTHVTLGLRYTRDEKSLRDGYTIPLAGLPNTPAALAATTVFYPGAPYAGNPNGIPTSSTFPKLTYKAVIAQDITDAIHAYASYNRGFRSGAYNPTNFSNVPSQPETLDAFDAGVKSDLFNRVLRLNIDAFHYDYKNLQLRTSISPPAPVGTTITFNAAAARVNGVDVEARFVPSRVFSFNANVSYVDGKYTTFLPTTCAVPRPITATVLGGNVNVTCDDTGHRMINTPRWSFNVGPVINLPTDIGAFTLTATDSYKSRSYWDPSNRLSQAPYHVVSASLTWTSVDKRYDLQLYVRNLTKAYYFILAAEGTTDVYAPGAPRTFGFNAGFHF